MKAIYRFLVTPDKKGQALAEIRRLGVPARVTECRVIVDLERASPDYSEVLRWCERFDGSRRHWGTTFEPAELAVASWLKIRPLWRNGYPEPLDSDIDYRDVSYSLDDYCSKCGLGSKQTQPIRISKRPRWGRRWLMGLHWIYDLLLVRPEIWKLAFEPLGVECTPVANKRGELLDNVVQLRLGEVVELDYQGFDLVPYLCPSCGRQKYSFKEAVPVC